MDNPTSYLVIIGDDGSRAYASDGTTLTVASPDDNGEFDFANAQSGMIGLDLLANPSLASPGGKAIDQLRTLLKQLKSDTKPAAVPAQESRPAA